MWFLKSAEQNDTSAQSNLGFLYERGLGVRLDYVEAFKWLSLAAESGDLPSRAEHAIQQRRVRIARRIRERDVHPA